MTTSRAERAYALLLLAFPRCFRDRFGAEMRAAFHERLRDEGGLTIVGWLAVGADLVGQGIAERASELSQVLEAHAQPPSHGRRMDTLRQDLRFALRTFASTRAPTLVAIVVLAFGIGANTAIFSVVESVLLRSLPFREPERLVGVGATQLHRRTDTTYRYGTGSRFAYETWRGQRDVFEDVAGYRGKQPILTGLGDPDRPSVYSVTANFFTMLGASPALGRAIVPDDSLPTAGPVVVVSDAFWKARLGGDPRAIGRNVMLDGLAHTVVGVMPRSFHFPESAVMWRAFLPATETARDRSEDATHRAFGGYWSVGRLRPGVTRSHAIARLDAVTRALDDSDWQKLGAVVVPLQRQLTGEVRRPLLLVLGAVGFVLLVACANVANIQLARAAARERELALRLAVGARRSRLLQQLLTESVLLALVGGAAGVLLAYIGVPMLVRLGGDELPKFTDIGVDGRVLVATLGISMLTGILFGIVPAILSIRRANPQTLKTGTSGAGTSAARHRVGDTFVVLQLALTLVLLAGAGLLATSFARLTHVDIGFSPERVLVAEMRSGMHGDTATIVFARALLDRARAIRGVAAAAVSTGTPLAEGALVFGIDIVGRPKPSEGMVVLTNATHDYFATLGIPLRRGRLVRDDPADQRESIVVSEALARTYFPAGDAIGQRLKFFGKNVATIVGVVGDTKALALDEPPPPKIYQSFEAVPAEYLKLVVRASGSPAALAAPIRAAVRELDAGLPIDRLSTMRSMMGESLARQRFYTTLLVSFAAMALLMASAGLYGLVSYTVTRRTRELGVRVALGATAGDVRRLMLGRGGRLALGGVTLGLVGAVAATRVLRSMLYEVSPTSPLVLVGVAALLGFVAVLASWAPARRAGRVDPVGALRSE